MADNKTKSTKFSVARFIDALTDPVRRSDAKSLIKVMQNATGEKPRMWGPSIIGFGSYHYKYASGREGDSCLLGFASRKGDISIYGLGTVMGREELASKLGKHKMGKGCLYISKMTDIDVKVLEQLLKKSVAESKKPHG